MGKRKPATINSVDARVELFGILNAEGQFWSSRSFGSIDAAAQYIRDYWGADRMTAEKCLRTHRIVPVEVQMTALEGGSDG